MNNTKFPFPTNFDGWFTYYVHSRQNSVSVEIVLDLLTQKIFGLAVKNCSKPPSFTTKKEEYGSEKVFSIVVFQDNCLSNKLKENEIYFNRECKFDKPLIAEIDYILDN